jgi:hypothetical protein
MSAFSGVISILRTHSNRRTGPPIEGNDVCHGETSQQLWGKDVRSAGFGFGCFMVIFVRGQ